MTEVLIPEEKRAASNGWVETSLGQVCKFRGGGTPSKNEPKFWEGSIPWVSPKDVKSDIIMDSLDHISKDAIENSAVSMIPQGSVLIVVRSGILARTVPLAISGTNLTVNQDLKALVPSKAVDSRFLFYLLRSKESLLLSKVTKGATVHRLATDDLKSLRFGLPSLSEQKRIVAILDEAFADIAKAKADAEKNLKNAREFYRSSARRLFGFPESPEVPLGRVCQLRGGGTPSKYVAEYWNGDIPWVSPKDVKIDLVCDSIDHVSAKAIEESATSFLPTGSVLIVVRSGILARTVPLALTGRELTINQDLKALIPHESVRPDFLFHLLKSREEELLALVSKGATVHRLPSEKLRSLGIVVPSSEKQRRAVEAVLELGTHVVRLQSIYQQKLTALEELKQSLLHKAFTGRL